MPDPAPRAAESAEEFLSTMGHLLVNEYDDEALAAIRARDAAKQAEALEDAAADLTGMAAAWGTVEPQAHTLRSAAWRLRSRAAALRGEGGAGANGENINA